MYFSVFQYCNYLIYVVDEIHPTMDDIYPSVHGWDLDLAELLERLAVNAKVATVLGSISASSDTVKSEGRYMKQCWITYLKREISKNIFFM